MILKAILIVVFAVVTGMLFREGLWRSILAFFNMLLAATLAVAWFGPLADFLTSRSEGLREFRYLLDFIFVWLLFCVVLALAREATDRMSRRAVAFPPQVERIGAGVVAAMAGWLFMCFTAATLHTAPVPRDFIQPTPEARMLFGLAPDRRWLSWVRRSSLTGPFSRSQSPFDEGADFILRSADRRLALERAPGLRVEE